MARSAPRTLAALRLRPAKAESKPPESPPKSAPKSPSKSGPKSAPRSATRSDSKSKSGSKWSSKFSSKVRKAPKPAPEPAPKASPPPKQARQKRRPFAFLARVLTILIAFVFMVAFAVILARLTLEPSPASVALTHNNLHPGRSLRAYLDQPELRDAVRQIGGNILLGAPFGVLMPVVAPGRAEFCGCCS